MHMEYSALPNRHCTFFSSRFTINMKTRSGFGCQKVFCEMLAGRLHKIIACCQLPKMDFLNVPGCCFSRTQPSAIRHPGSMWTFRDIRVPQLLRTNGTLRKSHFFPQVQRGNYFVQSAIPIFCKAPFDTPIYIKRTENREGSYGRSAD